MKVKRLNEIFQRLASNSDYPEADVELVVNGETIPVDHISMRSEMKDGDPRPRQVFYLHADDTCECAREHESYNKEDGNSFTLDASDIPSLKYIDGYVNCGFKTGDTVLVTAADDSSIVGAIGTIVSFEGAVFEPEYNGSGRTSMCLLDENSIKENQPEVVRRCDKVKVQLWTHTCSNETLTLDNITLLPASYEDDILVMDKKDGNRVECRFAKVVSYMRNTFVDSYNRMHCVLNSVCISERPEYSDVRTVDLDCILNISNRSMQVRSEGISRERAFGKKDLSDDTGDNNKKLVKKHAEGGLLSRIFEGGICDPIYD